MSKSAKTRVDKARIGQAVIDLFFPKPDRGRKASVSGEAWGETASLHPSVSQGSGIPVEGENEMIEIKDILVFLGPGTAKALLFFAVLLVQISMTLLFVTFLPKVFGRDYGRHNA